MGENKFKGNTMKLKSILVVFAFLYLAFAQNDPLVRRAETYLQILHKPQSIEKFNPVFHFPPRNQDTTNACWSFSTLSFLESEMQRNHLKPVKLSMMFPVYFAFVEKARYFVQTKGASRFAGGDLFSGVLEVIKQYGMVPQSVYFGQVGTCQRYTHVGLERELKAYMKKVKVLQQWDEALVLKGVRRILDAHLGAPPQQFVFEGKSYTPQTFRDQVVRLPWKNYVAVTSFLYAPFYQYIELKVPDNWKHRAIFYNLPLKEFYSAIKQALDKGYSVAFDSDTGEPGRMGKEDVAFVPPYDVPAPFINQEAREFRFRNGSTTDDHLMHILAYKNFDGQDWFLVKDSWRTAWDGKAKGYFYFHGDYLRLKMLAFLVDKKAIKSYIKK